MISDIFNHHCLNLFSLIFLRENMLNIYSLFSTDDKLTTEELSPLVLDQDVLPITGIFNFYIIFS